MKKLKNIILIPIIFILILPLMFSILNLFKIEVHPIIYLLSINIIVFITAYKVGLNTPTKGYVKGLKTGLIFSLFLFIISLILKGKITWFTVIYYLIIILISILGSITGINSNKNTCKN